MVAHSWHMHCFVTCLACYCRCCSFCLLVGWFEFVSDYLDFGPISEADAAGKHVINPHTFALELFKPVHDSY